MAMLKYGHAAATTAMVDPGKWVDKVVPAGRIKVAKNVIATYDPSQWLLSHVTIIASVDTDRADPEDPKSNYLIKPEYSVFVNNNGDSWEREMLRACYKSFLGANNYCFTAGTRVLMADGTYKPIDEIQVGDKVINRLGRPSAVLRTFVHEADDLVEVKSRAIMSRSLFVTANHPFWVYSARRTCPKTGRPNRFDKDKDFCRLDKWLGFSVGVHKAAGESFPCGISGSWRDAGCIDPDRDFLTHPVSDLEVPNEEVNENRATLIGWFLAEGFYMRTNNSSDEESGVCFALGNDEYDVAVMLKDLLEKEFGEGFRTGCSPRVRETHSGSYTLCVSNKVVADFFKKWCGEYAWAKKLPEEAMWLPKGLQTRILRSCISGDGCGVLKSRGYTMELKSRPLVQQFMWISWRLGLLPTYKETGVLGRYAECNVVDGYDVYTDPETGKKSRPGYMIRYSCRDSKALDAVADDSSSLMFGKRDNRFTYKFSNDDGSWLLSKIEGVGPVEGSFTVHNIEVEGDNSYIAEGVAVHNCEHVQIPELAKGKVIDVALREVPFMKDKDGKDLTTLYGDILIATNRKHEDLINKITSGEYNATSMGCGLAGTPITMADGCLKPIETVEVGDLVLTHTGSSKPVTKLFSMPVKAMPLYSVDYVGANEPLRLTGEHPVLIARRESVRCTYTKQACRIDRDQSVCSWASKKRGRVKVNCGRDKDTYEYDISFVPISEVRKGDYIAKVYPVNVKDDEKYTEDLCRLVGLYADDGYTGWQWVDKKKDYPAYVGFCFGAAETELIEDTLRVLKRVCPPDTTITEKPVPERSGHYINVYDKKLASFLYENVGEGCWTKKFSDTIMHLPLEKQMRVVEGMFDTDGCFYEKTCSLSYSSVSSDLINQLHLILLRNGVANAREKVYRKPSGKKKTAGYQETVTVHKNFTGRIASLKNKGHREESSVAHDTVIPYKNYVLCPITSVTNIAFAGTVYNFSVEEDESYAVNDAAVHNCLIKYSQCSQCGQIAEDESKACKHVRFFKRNFFYDPNGVRRIVAELCGRVEDPESCRFIDASWVRKPAFGGAVLRNLVEPDFDLSEKFTKAFSVPDFVRTNKMYVKAAAEEAANEIVTEMEAQESAPPSGGDAPAADAPAAPTDDTRFPEAPSDAEKPLETGEAPPAEGGGETPPADAGAPGGAGAAPGGAPDQPPQPQIEEPAQDATAKEVKEMLKRTVLNEIRRDLMQSGAQSATQAEQRPDESDLAMNDSLVKEAGFSKLFKEASSEIGERLANAMLIMSNLQDWGRMARYGYSRDDVLGILWYVDGKLSNEPVGVDAVKALKNVRLASNGDPRQFFAELIVETGRKPSASESRKLLKWASILDIVSNPSTGG